MEAYSCVMINSYFIRHNLYFIRFYFHWVTIFFENSINIILESNLFFMVSHWGEFIVHTTVFLTHNWVRNAFNCFYKNINSILFNFFFLFYKNFLSNPCFFPTFYFDFNKNMDLTGMDSLVHELWLLYYFSL